MKTKLTLSVDRTMLAKAKRALLRRKRSISAEVDALLERIAEEESSTRLSWTEQFGDLRIPVPKNDGDAADWYAKHLKVPKDQTGSNKSSAKGRK